MSTITFRRPLAALLSALILCPTLAACAQDGENTPTGDTAVTTAATTTEPTETTPTSSVQTVDLEQQKISFITREPYGYLYPYHELLAEETTGDSLNDAIYKRNLILEDRYNCQLIMHAVDKADIANLVNQDMLSNNREYDIIMSSIFHNINWAQKQYLVEMHEFYDILQFDQPW